MVIQVQLGGGGGSPGGGRPQQWMMFIPGCVMIGLGLLILFFPHLLQLLIAALCVFVGVILIMAPLGLRRMGWPGTRNPFGPGGGGTGGFGDGGP